jgi:hypothetical protein
MCTGVYEALVATNTAEQQAQGFARQPQHEVALNHTDPEGSQCLHPLADRLPAPSTLRTAADPGHSLHQQESHICTATPLICPP